jgi:hypothetical protein
MPASSLFQRLRSWIAAIGGGGSTLTYGLVFVVGLLIGLVVLGWVVFPVRWTQALPSDLRTDYRDDYLRLVADSYALTGDLDAAVERLRFWKPADMVTLLGQLSLEAEAQEDTMAALRLRRLAEDAYAVRAARVQPTVPPAPTPAGASGAAGTTLTLFLLLLAALVVMAVLLVLSRALGVWPQRAVPGPTPAAVVGEAEAAEDEEPFWEEVDTDRVAAGEEEPEATEGLAAEETGEEEEGEAPLPSMLPAPGTVPATVVVPPVPSPLKVQTLRFNGDPTYNETRAITDNQVYLGEYGMGVGQTNPQYPDRVYSLEVWLFDKGDINTVTAVLLHPDVYADEELRQQAAGQHEAVPLQPGAPIHLRTKRLRLDGHIRRVEFGPAGPEGMPIRLAEVELSGGIL